MADKLHLGCGLITPEGWLNVDGSLQASLARLPRLKKLLTMTRIIPKRTKDTEWSENVVRLDLSGRLPYHDGQFRAVYSSHLLEHLHRDDALALLKECRRVLCDGGVCRAVVPDLNAIVCRYLRAREAGDASAADRLMEEMLMHEKGRKDGLLAAFHRLTALHQHKWMYDAASLAALFHTAGFREVRPASYLESRIDGVEQVEQSGRVLDGQGIVVEALK